MTYRTATAAIIALAVGFRTVLVILGLPPTNSDEATMGLMARHIAAGTDFPVFFYGQHYMGALEAYLAAPLFGIFGSSVVVLRLPALALFAVFLWVMYRLTVTLYTERFALLVVALLALGSDRVFKDQLIAAGGYPEVRPIAAALLLIAVLLALRRGSWPLFAVWGLVAGLAVWDHWLVLPYLAAAGALIAVYRGRDLLGRAGWALAGGLVVGAAPLIVHNLLAPASQNSLSVFQGLNRAGADAAVGATLSDHLHGGVLIGIPMATGLCLPSRCTPAQTWWGVAYLVLLGVAGWLAARRFRDPRQAGRLALVGAAALSTASYVLSPSSVLTPVESARYLSLLLVSAPAVLWPLWSGVATLGRRWRLVPAVALAAVSVLALVATVSAVGQVPEMRARQRAQRELIDALDRMRVTRIYSDYWTCNRITFATRERVLCATLDDTLRPGHDRYRPYQRAVAAEPRPAFVLPAGSGADRAFAEHLSARGIVDEPVEVAGYRIWRPAPGAGVPKSRLVLRR